MCSLCTAAIQLVFTEENVVVTDDTGTMEVCVMVADGQVNDGVSYRIPITVETINGTAGMIIIT